MRRLASKTVLRGFIAAWFLAASPIKRSSDEKATYDGVVRLPSGAHQHNMRQRCKERTVVCDDLDTVILPYTDAPVNVNLYEKRPVITDSKHTNM